jgi:hypothetical protein
MQTEKKAGSMSLRRNTLTFKTQQLIYVGEGVVPWGQFLVFIFLCEQDYML